MKEYCPNCGSHDPRVRLHEIHAHPGRITMPCSHEWHLQAFYDDEEERLFRALRKIFEVLEQIYDVLKPRPSSLKVQITGGTMPLPVGSSSTATLSVLDQSGNVIPNFDFAANAPAWAVDNTAAVSLSPGPNPNDEVFTGLAEGAVNGNVVCAGLTLTFTFQVVAVVQPPVPTSLRLDFNPPVA